MQEKFKPMFEPMQIGTVKVKNKFFMAPMATPIEVDEDYCYTPRSVEYFCKRAEGGVGLIITGANWIENEIEHHIPGSFPCPNHKPAKYLKVAGEMLDRCHAFDTKVFLQLTAGLGRSALPPFLKDEDYVAPSETTNRWLPDKPCRALTTEEVESMINSFVKGAMIAKKGGFDGVEIHAVHEGYLLDCFTMTLFNQRTDKFGGDLRGRLRFATEIVEKIKQACGKDFPVILRFSVKSYIKALRQGGLPGEEFEELGRDVEEAREAVQILQEAGYDAFDADAGTYDSWYWAHPPMYFEKGMYLPLMEKIRDVVKVPLIVAGRMDNLNKSLDALNSGLIDGIGLGRPLLADPEFVNKIRQDKIDLIRPCLGCHDGCFTRLLEGKLGSCAVNAACGRETMVPIIPATRKRKVVVVGGGPAAAEAARVAALRGHDVTLFEKRDRIGGELLIGGQPPFKVDDLALAAYFANALKALGVDVHLNEEATEEKIRALDPEVVLVAEGADPVQLKVKGADLAIEAQDMLKNLAAAKEKVVVVGGGLVGCEIALSLAMDGRQVTVIEALGDILKAGNPLPPMNEFMLRDELVFHKVNIICNAKVQEITEDKVVYETPEGKQEVAADQVVTAIGYKPHDELFQKIRSDYDEVYKLGDSRKVSNIRAAIWDGFEVGRII